MIKTLINLIRLTNTELRWKKKYYVFIQMKKFSITLHAECKCFANVSHLYNKIFKLN